MELLDILSVLDLEAHQIREAYRDVETEDVHIDPKFLMHQEEPHQQCQDRHPDKHKCRNPRCSLECRCNFAMKEAAVLEARLRSLPRDFHVYVGNIKILGKISEEDHRNTRTSFLKELRLWAKQNGATTKFRANSEIGEDERLHYHYAVFTTKKMSSWSMKRLWRSAAKGRKTILDHDHPRKGITAAAKYIFKDMEEVRQRKMYVRLFLHGTLPITWGSKDSSRLMVNAKTTFGKNADGVGMESRLTTKLIAG